MFAKLLKHEWRATAGNLGIFSIVALSLGVVGAVILRVLVNYGDAIMNSNSPLVLLPFTLMIMLFFLALGLVVYIAGAQIMLIYRFYKNKYTDEGYLTFTLPVNSHEIFLASYVNILLWTLIVGAVVVTSVFIALLFGTATEGLINIQFLSAIAEEFRSILFLYSIAAGGSSMPVVLMLLLGLVSWLYTPILLMTCVTVGAVVAKKLKLLAAIGCYYLANFIVSTVSGVFSSMVLLAEIYSDTPESIYGVYVLEIVLQLLIGTGCYFLSTWLMKHKLNLP